MSRLVTQSQTLASFSISSVNRLSTHVNGGLQILPLLARVRVVSPASTAVGQIRPVPLPKSDLIIILCQNEL